MKLRDIAKNILKEETNEGWVDLEIIGEEVGVVIDDASQDRLKSYYFAPWYCTDTWCGAKMYFLDDEPVCYSIQDGRKEYEEFSWFSKECAIKVKEYLISLKDKEDNSLNIHIESLDEEVKETYKIHYNNEVINWNYGLYNGKPFKFIKRIIETPNYGIDKKVLIEQDGKEFIVNIKDIDFKYLVK